MIILIKIIKAKLKVINYIVIIFYFNIRIGVNKIMSDNNSKNNTIKGNNNNHYKQFQKNKFTKKSDNNILKHRKFITKEGDLFRHNHKKHEINKFNKFMNKQKCNFNTSLNNHKDLINLIETNTNAYNDNNLNTNLSNNFNFINTFKNDNFNVNNKYDKILNNNKISLLEKEIKE